MDRIRECRADVGPRLAQYNLLYAVSFLRSPEEMDAFSFARAAGVGGPPQSDLQRAVTINIFGKPYIPPRPSTETSPLLYPTNTFSSRCCVLDLAAHQAQPWTPWTSQIPQEGTPASFLNLHPPFPYSQPTPPPPAHITPAPALQHTQLDQHLKPLAGDPP